MLAHELGPALERRGWTVLVLRRAACDITDEAAVRERVAAWGRGLVVNCAAYTKVDRAEQEPEQAFAANARGAGHVARAAASSGARLVHVSTNAVFDGALRRPYLETDPETPLGVYGCSKHAGELEVAASGAEAYVVRTGHLYGDGGHNFFDKLSARAREGGALRVVDDPIVAPTWTRDLAEQLALLVESQPPGLYHAMATGEASWYRIAREALQALRLDAPVQPVSTEEYGSPTPRARYSILANQALERAGICRMRPWEVALAEWLGNRS